MDDALPVFPSVEAAQTTGDTARALAAIAERVPELDEGELGLAFYFGTRTVVVGDDEPPEALNEPTPTEVTRAAGVQLARRALADLSIATLVDLAFSLRQPAERLVRDAGPTGDLPRRLETRGEELRSAHDQVRQDANESERLTTFLAMARTPLVELAADAFAAPGGTADRPVGDDAAPAADDDVVTIYRWPDRPARRVVLASKALGHDTETLASLARQTLVDRLLMRVSISPDERATILERFGFFDPSLLGHDELAYIASARFWADDREAADDLITKMRFGTHGRLEQGGLREVKRQLTNAVITPKAIFVGLFAVVIWLGCWLTVDINLTSAHGLYRDRLASAFLIRGRPDGEVTIEDDVDLGAICQYDAGSTAPYHIINAALNLQGSADAGLRDRRSDFFMFSKHFVGGSRTGYCRTATLERVFPQMSVATAMAISAAAASPNMGRATSPPLVLLMTLLNIRLGY